METSGDKKILLARAEQVREYLVTSAARRTLIPLAGFKLVPFAATE
jgi:hypothetical protein